MAAIGKHFVPFKSICTTSRSLFLLHQTQASAYARAVLCNTIVWRKQNQRNGQFKWNELNEEKRRHTHALKVNCSSEIRSIWTEKKKQKSDKYTERKTWKHENDNENKSEKQWKIVHINERATATALSPGNASLFYALALSPFYRFMCMI